MLRSYRCFVERTILLALFAGLVACASVSTSETHDYRLGDSVLRVSARAERGATQDHLFISVNGRDVADGPFGPEQAAGVLLHGQY